MNKILLTVLVLACLGLMAYNATMLDLNNPFQGDSIIALIGIMAALCALVLLILFQTSRKIQKKIEDD